jgi:hypothetical protein
MIVSINNITLSSSKYELIILPAKISNIRHIHFAYIPNGHKYTIASISLNVPKTLRVFTVSYLKSWSPINNEAAADMASISKFRLVISSINKYVTIK